jgi:hypothetical protein
VILLALCWWISAFLCDGVTDAGPVIWRADAGVIRVAGEAPPWQVAGTGRVEVPGIDVCTPIEPCEPLPGEVCVWRVTLWDEAGNPDAPCPGLIPTAWLDLGGAISAFCRA